MRTEGLVPNTRVHIIHRLRRFEHRGQPLLPAEMFRLRMLLHGAVALLGVGIALGVGIVGYHWSEGMPWIDALANAAMILGGMGPVNELHTNGGKVFAACYALFSGLAFIVIMSVIFGPVVHRFLHRFHLEEAGDAGPQQQP
jgi:hypothetical protein